MSQIEHWMMFGTFAEQRYFIYPTQSTYTGAIVNAHMVAHATAGIAGFLQEKAGMSFGYIIDPVTHAFQHDPSFILNNEGGVKSSINKLANEYGEPITGSVGQKAISPDDFSDEHLFKAFTERVLSFQKDKLSEKMKESDVAKYFTDESDFHPKALVAPYFYLNEVTAEYWLEVNIRAIDLAKETNSTDIIYASIVISQGLLSNRVELDKLIGRYADSQADGFIVWVDDLNEQEAGISELQSLVHLGQGLRGSDKQKSVINLHGGFFSIAASGEAGEYAFSGVTHGPEFGEYRGVVPVGGGIPIARYYIPKLHSRIRFREALNLFRRKGWLASAQAFHDNVCNCSECRDVLSGNADNFNLFGESTPKERRSRGGNLVRIDFPTNDAKIRCLKHYLNCKDAEYKNAEKSKQDLRKEFDEGVELFKDILGLDGVSHLLAWKKALDL